MPVAYLKASLSSLFIVSMSGSSTRKAAHSWQNSPKRKEINDKKRIKKKLKNKKIK